MSCGSGMAGGMGNKVAEPISSSQRHRHNFILLEHHPFITEDEHGEIIEYELGVYQCRCGAGTIDKIEADNGQEKR